MARIERPKCLFCGKLYRADARNAKHQKYCAEPVCRKSSKAASQRAWQAKLENRDYFRGAENVARVRAWRATHPGYWRRAAAAGSEPVVALQDICQPQPIEIPANAEISSGDALQDLLLLQPAVLVGFIAQFTGSALQDDIVRSTRRLVELGQDILAGRVRHEHQTGHPPRSGP